ncbi:MAG: NUDIX hydrolase [Gammaproteobacteria bacterium]|jgi:8-oxo-dGTP pyrophosphatase MutT (NUDIX family)|nr:NUDIX hydrolase [Gammaproteobacteria bacterium]
MRQPYKTARCILYRRQEDQREEYLLAVHNSFWGRQRRRWGLPGGQIERGESAESAVLRELEEELSVYVPKLIKVGPFPYKKSLHMVYAAEFNDPIKDYDDSELLAIKWFREDDVEALHHGNALHASYELHAIRALKQILED